jgi:hypothetical protein
MTVDEIKKASPAELDARWRELLKQGNALPLGHDLGTVAGEMEKISSELRDRRFGREARG